MPVILGGADPGMAMEKQQFVHWCKGTQRTPKSGYGIYKMEAQAAFVNAALSPTQLGWDLSGEVMRWGLKHTLSSVSLRPNRVSLCSSCSSACAIERARLRSQTLLRSASASFRCSTSSYTWQVNITIRHIVNEPGQTDQCNMIQGP